jgi:hypothetical protein
MMSPSSSVSSLPLHDQIPTPDGLSFATFSDGYDDGFRLDDDVSHYMFELKGRGSQALNEFFVSSNVDLATHSINSFGRV